MNVQSIQIINFEPNLNSADIIICNDQSETYTARIHQIGMLLEQLKNGKQVNTPVNYFYLPDSLIVDEISEDYLFEMVNHLLDDGDFFNVFKKV